MTLRQERATLPDGWQIRRLGELSSKTTVGFVGSMSHLFTRSGVPLLRGTNVHPGWLQLDDMRFISEETHRRWSKSALEPGDLVMVRVGYPGTTSVIPSDLGLANAASLVIARPKRKILNPYFAMYVLNSPAGARQLQAQLVGGAQQVFNTTLAAKYEIAVPEIEEQDRIVDALRGVDGLISSLMRLVTKKRAVRQGMMQELLTGRTRLPGFVGDWTTLHVASSSHLKARIGWQGLTTGEYQSSGEYRLVGGTDFDDGRVDWSRAPYVDKWRFDQDKNIQLQIGDVLITKDGTIGKVAFIDSLPGPATLNSGVFVVRPKVGAYDSGFLFHLLRSRFFDEFVAGLSAGSTINHLYQRDLVTLDLVVPNTLAEQRAIAAALFDADGEITALERRLEATRAVQQGMMQELLTGRTRLGPTEASA